MNVEVLRHPAAKISLLTGVFIGMIACGKSENTNQNRNDFPIVAEVPSVIYEGHDFVCRTLNEDEIFTISVEAGQTIEESLNKEFSTRTETMSEDYARAVAKMNNVVNVDTTFPNGATLLIPQDCEYKK